MEPTTPDSIRIPCPNVCPQGLPCACAGEKPHELHICEDPDCACHSERRYKFTEGMSNETIDLLLQRLLQRLGYDALRGSWEAIEALDDIFPRWETHLKKEQREKIERYRQEMLEEEA